jgi:hypothetical protein
MGDHVVGTSIQLEFCLFQTVLFFEIVSEELETDSSPDDPESLYNEEKESSNLNPAMYKH